MATWFEGWLVMVGGARIGVTEMLELFEGLRSGESELSVTVFVSWLSLAGVTNTVLLVPLPFNNKPRFHVRFVPSLVYPVEANRNDALAGSVSVSFTFLAGEGPWFVTLRVYASAWPARPGLG